MGGIGFLRTLGRIVPAYRRLLEDLQRTRDGLLSARRAAALSKSRTTALELKVARLRARVERLNASNRALKSSLAARTLSPSVLGQLLTVRLGALKRSSRMKVARAVEEEFASRSPSYRETLERASERTAMCAAPVVAHGLHWWIPRQATQDPHSLEARVSAGYLPLRTILSTREFAQGSVMLDIGANIGTTSIPRVILGDFQRVYAAEPEPANYACLVQNVVAHGLGGFVMPDRIAIGSEDGEVTLELAPTMGAHRIVALGRADTSPGLVSVSCTTLDTWMDALSIEPELVAFVKCDVQGWEVRVLEGASRTLGHRHIVWQLEVSPKHLGHAGSSLHEFSAVVQRHFERFIDLGGDSRRDQPVSDLESSLDYLTVRRRFTDILVYNT